MTYAQPCDGVPEINDTKGPDWLATELERACDQHAQAIERFGQHHWHVIWWAGYIRALEVVAGVD